MCVNAFFPKPPDPPALAPAKKPDPIITATKPMAKPLVTPDEIAKVDFGGDKKKKQGGKDAPRVTADSLKINLGGTEPTSNTGGLNV
mgnify:CR=1 FL=1|tara:strand:- start:419 stop:679 length:261 start_codon:yes stop_codon:yes gene_type:complete